MAVSGGSDSMALLHLLRNWSKTLIGLDNYIIPKIHVLTVDHGLRAESSKEVSWVHKQCTSIGVGATILKWHGDKPKNKIQELAREARYDLMSEFCQKNNISLLVLAHHQDDQVETMLMRLARGTGIDGLAAMAEKSDWNGIEIYRPLLSIPKDELVSYLQIKNLKWLEDPSNKNTAFERVRIRQTFSHLRELGISSENINKTAKRLQRAKTALEQMALDIMPNICHFATSGYARLDTKQLLKLPEEIALRILSKVLQYVRGIKTQTSMSKIETLLQDLITSVNIETTLSGCIISKNNTQILMAREVRSDNQTKVKLAPDMEYIWDKRFKVTTATSLHNELTIDFLSEQGFLWLSEENSIGELEDKNLLSKTVRASLPAISLNGKIISVPHLKYSNLKVNSDQITLEFISDIR